MVDDGVFFYFPPESRDFFGTFSLCNSFSCLKSAGVRPSTEPKEKTFRFVPCIPSRASPQEPVSLLPLRRAFSKGDWGVGTISPELIVSPVLEAFGSLWQWRPLTMLPLSSMSRAPPYEKSEELGVGSSWYFMVPFLLYPGSMIDTKSPVLSSAAVEEIFQNINALRLARSGVSSSEKEVTLDCMNLPFGTSPEGCGPTETSLSLPTGIGNLRPIIVPRKGKKGCGASLSNGSSLASSEGNEAVWASSYFELLDLFVDWKEARRYGSSGKEEETKSLFRGTLEESKKPESRGENSMYNPSSDSSKSVVDFVRQPTPKQRDGESIKRYAERCWMSYVGAGEGSSSSSREYRLFPSDDQKHVCKLPLSENTSVTSLTARSPALASLFSTSKRLPIQRIPPDFRNVIGGGLAELILSLDRYAALISRGELSVPAACWALLCDMVNPEAVFQLRSHAVMLEKEVMAATAAHKRLALEAVKANQTLVGKSCQGDGSLLTYPRRMSI